MTQREHKTRRQWPLTTARRRLDAHARRVRRLLIVAAVVAALVAFDRLGWGAYSGGDLARYDGRAFLVVRVVDGDTLDVAAQDGGKEFTRVRLWGIDAPEIAKPWEPADAAQPGAQEAKSALAAWVEHRLVFLQVLPHRVRDDFGRVLAFVRDTGGACLNERLVRQGHARADGRWWHPHRAKYDLLEQMARHAGSRRGPPH